MGNTNKFGKHQYDHIKQQTQKYIYGECFLASSATWQNHFLSVMSEGGKVSVS